MSIKLTTMVEKSVEVKSVKVFAKVCDSAVYEYKDADGSVIKELDGEYVPSYFPTEHYGDYLELDIDLSSGQILNWKSPSADELNKVLNGSED